MRYVSSAAQFGLHIIPLPKHRIKDFINQTCRIVVFTHYHKAKDTSLIFVGSLTVGITSPLFNFKCKQRWHVLYKVTKKSYHRF